jgi:hypothetical protein
MSTMLSDTEHACMRGDIVQNSAATALLAASSSTCVLLTAAYDLSSTVLESRHAQNEHQFACPQ